MKTFFTIQDILLNDLGSRSPVSENSLLANLGLDSLDYIELAMHLEEEFDIEIPEDDAEKWLTVADIVTYVDLRVYKPEASAP